MTDDPTPTIVERVCPTCGTSASDKCPDPFHRAVVAVAVESPSAAYRRRVEPSPDRPRLSPGLEAKIAPVDERSARTYDLLEEAGEGAERLAQAIEDGVVRVGVDSSESLVYALRPPKKPEPPPE